MCCSLERCEEYTQIMKKYVMAVYHTSNLVTLESLFTFLVINTNKPIHPVLCLHHIHKKIKNKLNVSCIELIPGKYGAPIHHAVTTYNCNIWSRVHAPHVKVSPYDHITFATLFHYYTRFYGPRETYMTALPLRENLWTMFATAY